MMRSFRPVSANKGFTLVEVLVTVVIFSVGLLGLAGLQATGIKLNHSSLIRSQATLLAYDIIDCMRVNRSNVDDYAIAKDAAPPSSPSDLAGTDLALWRGNLAAVLPSGYGSVTLNGNRATVEVYWDELRSGSVPTDPLLTVVSEI